MFVRMRVFINLLYTYDTFRFKCQFLLFYYSSGNSTADVRPCQQVRRGAQHSADSRVQAVIRRKR